MNGYAHADYARSLESLGRPLALPDAGGWLLERTIGETGRVDAIGPYPLFDCENWASLPDELAALGRGLVSVCVVPDPLAPAATPAVLRAAFPDLVRQFKTCFVRSLSVPVNPSPHHRRNVRRALKATTVERASNPASYLEDWLRLHRTLSERHALGRSSLHSGVHFGTQVRVPGVEMFVARCGPEIVGIVLWFGVDERVHYHLAAYSERGYEIGASFAVFQVALEHFRTSGFEWAAFGGAPGLADDTTTGLARFKQGWATETRHTLLCGRILDGAAYHRMSEVQQGKDFFPAYRAPTESRTAS